MPSRFILASGSPRRRELIAALGIDFDVITPDIDEDRRPGEPPLDYVRRLSREKAQAVANQLSGASALVLAADTVVVLAADTIGVLPEDDDQGDILAKPPDAAAARATLRRLRDRAHIVCTAFTLLPLDDPAAALTDMTRTRVHMKPYTDADIEAYIATGDPFDKAGGYAIQHAGFRPVAHIDGCYNNVVGLPVCAVKRGLARLGWPGIVAPVGCDCPPFNSRAKMR